MVQQEVTSPPMLQEGTEEDSIEASNGLIVHFPGEGDFRGTANRISSARLVPPVQKEPCIFPSKLFIAPRGGQVVNRAARSFAQGFGRQHMLFDTDRGLHLESKTAATLAPILALIIAREALEGISAPR